MLSCVAAYLYRYPALRLSRSDLYDDTRPFRKISLQGAAPHTALTLAHFALIARWAEPLRPSPDGQNEGCLEEEVVTCPELK